MRTLVPLLLCIALAGCGRDIRNDNAVREGVLDHLASRNFNLASMDVSVTRVVYRKNEADATVSFSPKGSKEANGMVMQYTLAIKGNKWVVKERADGGANPHGGGDMANPHGGGDMANPHGGAMPPADGAAPSGSLPPGHPAVPPPDSGPK